MSLQDREGCYYDYMRIYKETTKLCQHVFKFCFINAYYNGVLAKIYVLN